MKNQKVILVTGASSGIGKATALKLIKEGYIVYGAARRIDKMNDLEIAGGKSIQMDITEEAALDACIDQIVKDHGRIDVLVNNAGYAVYGSVEDITIDEARRQFDVNIFGLAAITQKVLPHMRKQNSGTIINISSVGGKIYTPLGSWYHATKHALEGWSDCLRLELKQFGIDVVIIEPGLIKTEFGDVLHDPMLERSKGGPYEKLAATIAKTTKETYEKPGNASEPTVIADAISKAIKKPKTRYAAGKLAKAVLFMRWFASDKLFDRVIMSQAK
jgi:short-subunit dehydrogenase